ncbi:UDP-glycosyltransferase 76G1-like [Rutidosis leptorrhynchoides]|uniref:UDP-glycosyltransferase 76G1-like n=1 Tax=Rutidosis leptorrhynchoides TaxID=125765 RepID=UPI003A99B4F1
MEIQGSKTALGCTQPIKTSRRIVLFPLPFQGHINPMLQLANILHTQGFKITIIHAEYNSPNPSNYPHFIFKSIKDRFSEIADQLGTNKDPSYFVRYLNKSCVEPFKECLARLLAESDTDLVACVITDAGFYFTQAVADDLKIPRMVLRTSSLGCVLAYDALPFYSKKDCFNLTKEASEYCNRGRVVKWSPQQEVLAHSATGCFWTHNGWNSTLESICEGVPMICSPNFADQPVNARYVTDVWKIGVMLENGFEMKEIEMAIRRIMTEKEGEEMNERISCLKKKLNISLNEGGSSNESLQNLVHYISSL